METLLSALGKYMRLNVAGPVVYRYMQWTVALSALPQTYGRPGDRVRCSNTDYMLLLHQLECSQERNRTHAPQLYAPQIQILNLTRRRRDRITQESYATSS